MYSDYFMMLQPVCCIPQYINVPAYGFENLLVSPFSIGEMPISPHNSFYPQQNEVISHSPIIKIENIPETRQNKRIGQIQQKGKLKTQVCIKKKKVSTKRKNNKNSQKDDRNVVSNLLKIFFKNMLDLRKWDQYLKSLIQKYGFHTSLKRFFQWISDFRVNYRNYIKAKEIKVLLSVQHCRDHQLMFRAVLRRFVHLHGLAHCLTARRIDRASVRRHVQGLRELQALSTGKQI